VESYLCHAQDRSRRAFLRLALDSCRLKEEYLEVPESAKENARQGKYWRIREKCGRYGIGDSEDQVRTGSVRCNSIRTLTFRGDFCPDLLEYPARFG
jgi:hypothetical protein